MALATYVNTTPAGNTQPPNDDSEEYMDPTPVGAPTEPSNDSKPPFSDITEDSPKTNKAGMEESRRAILPPQAAVGTIPKQRLVTCDW
ncbi:hypothetical protein ACET3Z_001798 [Daucus carota]